MCRPYRAILSLIMEPLFRTYGASATVIAELRDAPEPKRTDTLALLEPLRLLAMSAEVDELTTASIAHKLMPRDAAGDARHLAVATFLVVIFS